MELEWYKSEVVKIKKNKIKIKIFNASVLIVLEINHPCVILWVIAIKLALFINNVAILNRDALWSSVCNNVSTMKFFNIAAVCSSMCSS